MGPGMLASGLRNNRYRVVRLEVYVQQTTSTFCLSHLSLRFLTACPDFATKADGIGEEGQHTWALTGLYLLTFLYDISPQKCIGA